MLSSVRKPPPLVTGLSPKEGPPGTRVTIRGENLGIDAKDLIGLRICGVDCLLSGEWKSPNKIVARTGQAKGVGDIVVVTRSGGVGSCTVQFKGFVVHTGILQESAVWVDESQTWSNVINRNRNTTTLASEHDDPLGISDESNDTKFPHELSQIFPDGSGNTSDEKFIPAWFLLENHHGTSFDDLKAGLAYLKRRSSLRNEGPLAFVKANLTTFMDCQNTLAEMHHALVEDQAGAPNGYITHALEQVLMQANRSADVLFQDVLKRKDTADATRNALNVLHRFKFLFNLPCNIERNIKKGDYDMVITDYTRAKSLFGDTEVPIFIKVYREVENRVEAFREMLYRKLLHLPLSLDEQKKLIRYLVHLERPGDPAWECLENMQIWLRNLLQNCKDQHIAKEEEQEDKREDFMSPKRLSTSKSSREPSFRSGSKAPQKVVFVDDITKILTDHFPDFWRLGQAYFSGKLLKDAKDKSVKIDALKHTKFRNMVGEVITLYSYLVRGAFLPTSLTHLPPSKREIYGRWKDSTESPSAWLPICVRCVRSCLVSLNVLELPSDSQEILSDLAFDMRANCMVTLLNKAITDIQGLHGRETWMVNMDDVRGGTTLLPALFENTVSESVQMLHEVLQPRPGEVEIFSQRPIQKEAVDLCVKLFQAFSNALNTLAQIGNVERSVKSQSPGRTIPRSAIKPDLFFKGEEHGMPSLDKRLVVMLSNSQYTLEHIIPRLVTTLEKQRYPETNKVQQLAMKAFMELDESLFEKYIEEKANPIVGFLEQNMYAGNFEWNDCLQSTGVRQYLKLALLSMIEIHAEVYSISPQLVPRVMGDVVESVVEELSRLILCVTGFNHNGALQARLELYAVGLAIDAYATDKTKSCLKEALECLPDLRSTDDKRLLEDLLNKFQGNMRFQLMCFQPESNMRASVILGT